ncbi:MAG: hypothetical protein ABIW84_02935 [Ilumatobacteraceae bacterium]
MPAGPDGSVLVTAGASVEFVAAAGPVGTAVRSSLPQLASTAAQQATAASACHRAR